MQIDELIKELQEAREQCIKEGWNSEDIYVRARNIDDGRTSDLRNINIGEYVEIDVDFYD